MRTKEIEVWVNEDFANGLENIWCKRPGKTTTIKAKLIIEIPDRKIELTESQFDEAVKYAIDSADDLKHGETEEFEMILKEKLFGVS